MSKPRLEFSEGMCYLQGVDATKFMGDLSDDEMSAFLVHTALSDFDTYMAIMAMATSVLSERLNVPEEPVDKSKLH